MRIIRLKHIFVLCAFMCATATIKAVPAYPGVIKATQPDGTVIEITLQGDEHFNWATTTDGYTLLRNNDNYWTLAQRDDRGWLVPSNIIYRNDTQIALEENIDCAMQFPQEQLADHRRNSNLRRAKDNGLQVDGTFPSKGENKLLLLMLNYSDTETTFTKEDFELMMNEENYKSIGSFRDFYLENSYGQLDITTVVTRWVTLPYEKSYYGADKAIEMIQNGLNIIDDEIDLADFDNDGDGVLDGLAVIHQGTGQEYSGAPDEVWSHSSVIYGMSFDGIQVRRYTIEPELLNGYGDMATIGVICHEFGHNLGAPDFYDSDYQASGGYYPGTGTWDLMASGAWNGISGDRPAGINMWQKIQCGWVTPTILDSNQDIAGMTSAHNTPVAYRFDTTVPGEYFILENRQQQGAFDVALPGHGMLIYHANDTYIKGSVNNNTVNASYPQAMYLVSAAAGQDPTDAPLSYGDLNTTGTPFPGTSNVTAFNDATLPSAKSITGRNTYKGISNIREDADGTISFTFTKDKAPASPINLQARNEKGVVILSWEMPQGVYSVEGFNVYRNGVLLSTVTDCTYVDDNTQDESYVTYYVDAIHSNGLVSPYTSVSTRIPVNFVTALEGTADQTSVSLDWDIETRLTRMVDINSTHTYVDYNVPVMDYVHRFRAEDLQIYKGYKIRKISYLPFQSQKDLTLTLRVWEADADGSNPTIISERVVKEYGSAVWNTTLLTKSVEITGEKELWVGLHCESSTGTIRLLTDNGPVVEDYGNWIKIGDEEWGADRTLPGNIFLYIPLVEPTDLQANEITETGILNNPYLDMLYPVGFAVYRDNELLTWTDGCQYVDNEPLSGLHTYSIASLYRGNNESVPMTIEVVYNDSQVEGTAVRNIGVRINNNILTIPGYEGNLIICDTMGRIIYNNYYQAQEAVVLNDGIYIVKTENNVDKVVVK